jgi:hypothetical protein
MSEPLNVIGLLRQLVQKEITIGILKAEVIKYGASNIEGQVSQTGIERAINILEQDCSSLTHRLAEEIDK